MLRYSDRSECAWGVMFVVVVLSTMLTCAALVAVVAHVIPLS